MHMRTRAERNGSSLCMLFCIHTQVRYFNFVQVPGVRDEGGSGSDREEIDASVDAAAAGLAILWSPRRSVSRAECNACLWMWHVCPALQ